MERNYQKEHALAVKKIAELQELLIAYQAMYDDVLNELNSKVEKTQKIEGEK